MAEIATAVNGLRNEETTMSDFPFVTVPTITRAEFEAQRAARRGLEPLPAPKPEPVRPLLRLPTLNEDTKR